jgi:two-component system, sensor histidine kinase
MSAPSLSGRVVLVIEDNDDMRDALVLLLTSRGARVLQAADGLAGLAELARGRPDVVFCDLMMPVMDGLEFARRMRQNPAYHGVLLIAVTAHDSPAFLRKTWMAGFDGHLVKPVTVDQLASIARRLAGGSDLLSTA